MNLIPDTILRAVCWTLLHSLWQGFILAVVAGLVMVLSKKAGSALRYNLLCGLMILFVAVSSYTFYRQLQAPVTAGLTISPVSTNNGFTPSISNTPFTGSPVTGHTLQNRFESFIQYFNTHASLVVVTWFIIFLARFVKIVSGLVYVQRIRHYQTNPAPAPWQEKLKALLHKLQIRPPVLLLESALVKIPVVVGALKPVILIPIGMLTRLSPAQVESILIHELAHIRRRDYLFNLVQNWVDTLFFFNPALIWVSSLIRSERENCCDDIAIGETKSRKKFVKALVSFHEYTRSVQGFALSFADKESEVVKRVKRIVYKKNHSLKAGERAMLMGGVLLLSAAFITINSSRLAMEHKQPAGHSIVLNNPGSTVANPARTTPPRLFTTTGKPRPATSHANPPAPEPDTVPTSKDTGEHQHSEDEGIVDQLHAMGYANITADMMIECGRHGVSADFIQSFLDMGYKNITLDKVIQLKDHGVRPGFIKKLNAMGYNNISLDKAIELKDHGVSAEFINSFKEKGYGDLTLEMATQLLDHGVRPGFMDELKQLGFKDITFEMATKLIDHGVTIGFITAFKKKTGGLLELRDYIKLRDAGINPS